MEQFCRGRGLAIDWWITEVGGGMDLKPEKLLAVMNAVEGGEIATLARFGFGDLEHVAEMSGCVILVANQRGYSRPDPAMVGWRPAWAIAGGRNGWRHACFLSIARHMN